jgi:hypothetical protein
MQSLKVTLTYSTFSYWPVPVKALYRAQRRSTDMFAAHVYITYVYGPSGFTPVTKVQAVKRIQRIAHIRQFDI